MPGFILHIGREKYRFPTEKREKLVFGTMSGQDYQLERRVVSKFMHDRLFTETEKYIVVIEGVVLNNRDLMKRYKVESWIDCVVHMYEQNGDAFFNDFRGSFSGILYDKVGEKWLVYTDHIGDKQIFVSKTIDGYLFGSEMRFLVEIRKANNLSCTLNETGAYFTITHGFCIEDLTLVQEIRKLSAGRYLKLQNGRLEEIHYHRFTNVPDRMTQEEAVEGIDRLFRQAIHRAFEKDKEYGYKHIACLSGGLDSRMTAWVAHEMGYIHQLNITFSQSDYLDFKIAQQIATDLGHEFLFKALDGGNCISLIDEITPITYGAANFFGLSHGYSMERLINYDHFGIIHTGQIGDSIIGTFFKELKYNTEVHVGQAAYSQEMIERLKNYNFKQNYENEEIFSLYTRAFTGANQGLLTFQENSESYSPFTDVDFIEFCYTIPLELRFNHKIYFDWILDKYPAAAEYVWESIQEKIHRITNSEPRTMKVLGYEVPYFTEPSFQTYLKGFMLRRLGLRKRGSSSQTVQLSSKLNMNPVDYWYQTNPFLRCFIDTYWHDNASFLPYDQLGDDLRYLYHDCAVYDKLQVLSVLSAIKLING